MKTRKEWWWGWWSWNRKEKSMEYWMTGYDKWNEWKWVLRKSRRAPFAYHLTEGVLPGRRQLLHCGGVGRGWRAIWGDQQAKVLQWTWGRESGANAAVHAALLPREARCSPWFETGEHFAQVCGRFPEHPNCRLRLCDARERIGKRSTVGGQQSGVEDALRHSGIHCSRDYSRWVLWSCSGHVVAGSDHLHSV